MMLQSYLSLFFFSLQRVCPAHHWDTDRPDCYISQRFVNAVKVSSANREGTQWMREEGGMRRRGGRRANPSDPPQSTMGKKVELAYYIHYHQLKHREVRRRETEYPIDHRRRVAFPERLGKQICRFLKSERASE